MRGRLAVAFVLLVAGCAAPDEPPQAAEGGPAASGALAGMPSLACEPDGSGQGMSPSLAALAFETFGGDGAFREEIDTAVIDGRTILAISQPRGDSLEFLDVTDPRAPAPEAVWYGDGGVLDDFKWLPDATGIVTTGATLRILDTRELDDVQVESTFDLADEVAGEGYGHTVAAWAFGGGTYVSIAKAEGGDVSIFKMQGAPGERSLERMSHLGATPVSALPGRPDSIRSHDTWFEVDPETGRPLLWVANVQWGVLAYDVSDPAAPVVASTMLPAPDNPLVGYMHTAQVTHVDGRRLVVGAQEYQSGVLKVWDATDLGAPQYLAYYHTPVATMPFHNLQVVGQYVFAAHFHDGLFVFDLSGLPQAGGPATMMEVFAHAPAEGTLEAVRIPVSPGVGGQSYEGTLEVVVQDGILWTTEVSAGLRSLAFGCMVPGDRAMTSTG